MSLFSEKIPFHALNKSRDRIDLTEALLFGLAGLLPSVAEDPYVQSLKTSYDFLFRKFQLHRAQELGNWRTRSVRPANSPALRVAQLAALWNDHGQLWNVVRSIDDYKSWQAFMDFEVSRYWKEHHAFGKKYTDSAKPDVSTNKMGNYGALGETSIRALFINVFLPARWAYSELLRRHDDMEWLVNQLASLPAEDNKITRQWKAIGVKVSDASDSQALLEQYNGSCINQLCLYCGIGHSLLTHKHDLHIN